MEHGYRDSDFPHQKPGVLSMLVKAFTGGVNGKKTFQADFLSRNWPEGTNILVGGLEHFFFHILGRIIIIIDKYFFRGVGFNHQPVFFSCGSCPPRWILRDGVGDPNTQRILGISWNFAKDDNLESSKCPNGAIFGWLFPVISWYLDDYFLYLILQLNVIC